MGIFTKTTTERQSLISVHEAYGLWDLLRSKIDAIDQLTAFIQFAHDADFKYIIQTHLKELTTNREILEGLLKEFGIQGPDQNRAFGRLAPGNPETLRDQLAARQLMTYSHEHIENLLRYHRASVTNDNVRKVIGQLLVKTVNQADGIYKYMKLKGWVEVPPMYHNLPPQVTESLSTAEVGQLWDHLVFRYDNLATTRMCLEVIKDQDFRYVIEQGMDTLVRQIKRLEEECTQYGLQMPVRPSEVIIAPTAAREMARDDHSYRMLLAGMQGAAGIHAAAMKTCLTSDRIRGLFKQLLLDETAYYDKFVKYGKLKGWLNPAPSFHPA